MHRATLTRVALALAVIVIGCGCAATDAPRGDDLASDAAVTPGDTDGGVAPRPEDGGPVAPALLEVRGIIHTHSPYSYDACDHDGLPGGSPDVLCASQMRAAVCSRRLDFVVVTDHPVHRKDYPFPELLLHDPAAGDALLLEGDNPVGKLADCGGGHKAIYAVGYELPTHTLALGMRHHVAPEMYSALTDKMALPEAQAQTQALKNAGAIAATAHAELPDISAKRIFEAGVEALIDGLRAGRNYGLYRVLGDPTGFKFHGRAGADGLVLGDHHAGPVELVVESPATVVTNGGAPFLPVDAARAQIRVELLRTDASGTTVVKSSTSWGARVVELARARGTYHVEIWIRPLHLTGALGTASAWAEREYLWIVTNPISVD